MENNHDQAHWYLLTGLIFGIAIGLVVSLLLLPAISAEVFPAELSVAGKNTYRSMIAEVYASNYNLERAASRLSLLGDPSPAEALVAQAQALLAQGTADTEARNLAQLATALQETQAAPAP